MLYLLLGVVFIGVLVVLWRAGKYYRAVGKFYQRFIQDAREGNAGALDIKTGWEERLFSLAAILPPGWLFLPLVPFWGLDALEDLVYQIVQIPGLLLTDRAIEKPELQNIALQGGDCILLGEQYDVNSGMAAGMRLDVLSTSVRLVSRRNWRAEANHIPVYTVRRMEREWALIEPRGERFVVRPISRESIITVLGLDGSVRLLGRGQWRVLQSGDRIVISMSEYQFIQLPRLVLRDRRTGEIVCENVERSGVWMSDDLSDVRISGGKLSASDDSLYQSLYPVNDPAWPSSGGELFHTILQPGDWIEVPDGSQWFVGYAVQP